MRVSKLVDQLSLVVLDANLEKLHHLRYGSEATRAFNNELRQALTIYDRSPKVNKQGVLIEQRAVYLTYHPFNDEYYVEIMWLNGTTSTHVPTPT